MIRFAEEKDCEEIASLLKEINLLHATLLPEVFKVYPKYTKEQVEEMMKKNTMIILVDDEDGVKGYLLAIIKEVKDNYLFQDSRTFYIDDICVDKAYQGKHIGTKLYQEAVKLAKEKNCTRVALNVWNKNQSALKFYESLGLKAVHTEMEQRIEERK
jgi:ribosomal protein S18 acetylase RimI-like enzyme